MTFKNINFNIIQNHIFQLYSKSYIIITFKKIYFNSIQNHLFQSHSKSYIIIAFKIIYLNEIIMCIYKTPLFAAIENEDIENMKLLLANDKLNVNILNIFLYFITKF